MAGIVTETNLYPDSRQGDSFQRGLEFQDFVMETMGKRGVHLQFYSSRKYQFGKGENLQGWEVKLDSGILKYSRLSIEIAEKTRSTNLNWINSGIYRIDNTWLYIQGNYECFYIFFKDQLIRLHKSGKYEEAV